MESLTVRKRFELLWERPFDSQFSHYWVKPVPNWPWLIMTRKPTGLPHRKTDFVVVGHDVNDRVFHLWNVTSNRSRPARTQIVVLSSDEALVTEHYSGTSCTCYDKNEDRIRFIFEFYPYAPVYSRYPLHPQPVFQQQQFQSSAGMAVGSHRAVYQNSNVAFAGRSSCQNWENASYCPVPINHFTGAPLVVQKWKAGDEDGSQTSHSGPSLRDDDLVRIFGHPRKSANSAEPLLLATRIMPVTDLSEVPLHYLDVLHAHAAVKKRKENISPKDLVLKSITKDNSVQGISLIELESSLKSLNLKVIKEAIDFLLNEGHIYATTDNMHFKSLDGYDWSPALFHMIPVQHKAYLPL